MAIIAATSTPSMTDNPAKTAPSIRLPLSPSKALEGYLLKARKPSDTPTKGKVDATLAHVRPGVKAVCRTAPKSSAKEVTTENHDICPLKESIMLNALATMGNATTASAVYMMKWGAVSPRRGKARTGS